MTDRLLHIGLHLAVDVGRLSVWLILLSILFLPLERLFMLAPGRRSSRETAIDLAYFFLNGLAPAVLISIPVATLVWTLNRLTPVAYDDAVASLPFGVKLVAALLVSELGSYWGHRWSHEYPPLWRFHSIHHEPERLNWLINTRAHPVDIVFTRICGLVPIYLLGLTRTADDGASSMIPVYVTLLGTVWAFFIHANVRWRFGPLEALVSTPAFHHWHHTNDDHRDHNYAALFPWVDRVFGTHHLPGSWPQIYGIDHALPSGLIQQLIAPFDGAPARGRRAAVRPRKAEDQASPGSEEHV